MLVVKILVRVEKKSFQKACENKKDDYLCTPLRTVSSSTNEWCKGKAKKVSLKIFSKKLVRNKNLITFATPIRTLIDSIKREGLKERKLRK